MEVNQICEVKNEEKSIVSANGSILSRHFF